MVRHVDGAALGAEEGRLPEARADPPRKVQKTGKEHGIRIYILRFANGLVMGIDFSGKVRITND